MARVNIEAIIEHLDQEMRKALSGALQEVAPDEQIDPADLYRAFVRGVSRACALWERVPDRFVRTE